MTANNNSTHRSATSRRLAMALLCLNLSGCKIESSGLNGSASSAPIPVISHFAGYKTLTSGLMNGPFATTRFDNPTAIATDGTNLYVPDANTSLIRKLDLSLGVSSTFAGHYIGNYGSDDGPAISARFGTPDSLVVCSGDLYIVDRAYNNIRKIRLSDATVSTFAGATDTTGTDVDGIGSAAHFNFAGRVRIGCDGTDLYVTQQTGGKIRKIALATAAVTTLTPTLSGGAAVTFNFAAGDIAGYSGTLYISDHNSGRVGSLNPVTQIYTPIKTGMSFPYGTAVDGTYIYVAQRGHPRANSDAGIWRIKISDHSSAFFSGARNTYGLKDGSASEARYGIIDGLTILNGYLYGVDNIEHVVRKISLTDGSVETITGSPQQYATDGMADGVGSNAKFNIPAGMVSDGTSIYVADCGNHAIRKINMATKAVATFAGTKGVSGMLDATGTSALFNFSSVCPMAIDGGYLYVYDAGNSKIRKIDLVTAQVTTLVSTAGAVGGLLSDGTYLFYTNVNRLRQVQLSNSTSTVLAGNGTAGILDGSGAAARLSGAGALTTDGTDLYFADSARYIRKVTKAGVVTTLAGSSTYGSIDGAALSAQFNNVQTLTYFNNALYMYVLWGTGLRKLDLATGFVTTIRAAYPGDMAVGSWGAGSFVQSNSLYIAMSGINSIAKYDFVLGSYEHIAGQSLTQITNNYVSVGDGKGSTVGCIGMVKVGDLIYCADDNMSTIISVDTTGAVKTVAGIPNGFYTTEGLSGGESFYAPVALVYLGSDFYTCDIKNKIRKIDGSTFAVTTIAGSLSGTAGSADGVGTAAEFDFETEGSCGLASDGTDLYIADTGNSTIRKLQISTGAVTTVAGSAGVQGSTDGVGASASFKMGYGGKLVYRDGYLYLSDSNNATIRRIRLSNGAVTTIVGLAGSIGTADGVGTSARLHFPMGMVFKGNELLIADIYSATIRAYNLNTHKVSTYAGTFNELSTTDGELSQEGSGRLFYPRTLLVDEANSTLYVDDGWRAIRKIRY